MYSAFQRPLTYCLQLLHLIPSSSVLLLLLPIRCGLEETFEDSAAIAGRDSAVVRLTEYLDLWEGRGRKMREGVEDRGTVMAHSQPPIGWLLVTGFD